MAQLMRTHDDGVYLAESRYETAKENFKFCRSFVPEHSKPIDIYDFGCAAGEFPFYLNQTFPRDRIHGVDILPSLIAKAKRESPSGHFQVGSVTDQDALKAHVSDVSFLIGVHSIFEDPTVCFANLIHWTKPGGTVIIFGLFNPHPVDVFIKVRCERDEVDHREPGWNAISQATTSRFLASQDRVASYDFHPFTIGIDLPTQADPLRSWTQAMHNGERQIINGIGLIHAFHALVIRLRD